MLDEDGEQRPICLTPDQATTCADLADGLRCEADGRGAICEQRYCLPGCGDGTLDVGEECDDGNFVSHDGCSSSCLSELAGWREWTAAWKPRTQHATGYHVQSQQLVILGGGDSLGLLGDQWIRNAAGAWTRSTPAVARRVHAAMAYDGARNKLVLFGGSSLASPLGDTWEFDGTSWTERAPVQSPTPRYAAGMVFDPSRNRIVLFGGRSNIIHDDTWEYDGVTWTQMAVATPPLARQSPAMAWDAVNQRVVMFGGYNNGARSDTWEYDNGTWTQITPASRPQARFGASAAFSTERNKVILFGGALSLTANASDTWEYDGATWTAVSPALSPPARAYASITDDGAGLLLVAGTDNDQLQLADAWRLTATTSTLAWGNATPAFSPSIRHTQLAYDTARHEAMAFSGCSAGVFSVPGTWVFKRDAEGSFNWVVATDGTADPTKRCYHASTYDPLRGGTVVFSGSTAGSIANLDDTWLWNGTTWTDLQPTTSPPARLDATLVADPHDGVVVLFGGRTDANSRFGDTWELAASSPPTWAQVATPTDLVPQDGAAAAYDPDQERVVLFDVQGGTWQYRDHAWSRLELDRSPSPRVNARMTWDPWRHRIMLFGGASTAVDFGDLWELRETTWEPISLLGSQPPARPRPALVGYPELRGLVLFGGVARGDTWILRFDSDTPEEDCSNGSDDDGDLQPDASDPDCTLYP